MAGIFPEGFVDEKVEQSLNEVRASALRLHTNTKNLLNNSGRGQTTSQYDHNYIAQEIVKCAYDTTKAIKALVTLLH